MAHALINPRAADQPLIRAWLKQVADNVRELADLPLSVDAKVARLQDEHAKLQVIVKVARRQARMQGAPNIRGINHVG